MRIDRMLSITILLLSRDRVSAKELAQRFEVSVRTIYRDMDAINVAGIPIVSFPGNDGGFGIMEGFKLDRQIFTTQDMISILSPLEGLNRAFKSEAITKVVDKIHSLIPSNQKEEVHSSLNRMIIDIQPWGENNRWKDLFIQLQKAIENQRIIKISYITGEGKTSIRDIEPMTLIFKSYTWYLWGYCLERSDYRLFKITRIKNLDLQNRRYIHRGESFKETEVFTGDLIPIKLMCDKSYHNVVIDKFGLENTKTIGDKIEINLDFPNGNWIKEFILSFGSNIKVVEPKWLQDDVKEDIKKMLNIYS